MFGFVLLALALCGLQLFLDRGQQNDWLTSWEIRIELGVAIGAAWMFAVHMITAKHPLFDRAMFSDRNFTTGLAFMAVTGVLLLAGLALLPPLLQTMYGYSVLQSGYLTAPRGVGTLISMLLAGRLTGKMDARILVGIGVCLMGMSLYLMTGFAIEPAVEPGDHKRRRAGAWPGPDLRSASEPCVRDARAEDADDGGRPAQPVAQHRRFGRHFGRQHAAGAHDPGRACGPCAQHHRADHPDHGPDGAADDLPGRWAGGNRLHQRWRSRGRRCSSPISTTSS